MSVIDLRSRMPIDEAALQLRREDQARNHNAEVAEKTRRLATLMAAYRERHPYSPITTPPSAA